MNLKVRILELCLKNEAAGKLPLQGVLTRGETIQSGEGKVIFMHATPFGTMFEVVTPLTSVKIPSAQVLWFKADMINVEEVAKEAAAKATTAEAQGLRAKVHRLAGTVKDRKD